MTELVAGSAIVTGASSGIGRAIAMALAGRGAAVGLIDVQRAGVDELVAELSSDGHTVAAARADISVWDDVDAAVTELTDKIGAPSILINAAGIIDGFASLEDMSAALWNRVISVNLTGTFNMTKRVLPHLLSHQASRLVNISSIAGVVGSGGGPAYTAAKHGIVGLTKQMALTYAPRGLTVNAIAPGLIGTGFLANSQQFLGADAPVLSGAAAAGEAAALAFIPANRVGTPEDVAGTACFLASDAAGYITGHLLLVDGGWTAQ
ncbi:SDR family NAD(P)-dependent oxidoreductase [Mycolicibacterium stellerae]|uniref:SDR family NAD(P)-dependent oxidoreductase n=1 Tax=Mycolicibacterium stellerae TaxID=2358193 RepID=UPI000F0B6DB8|nr:SDR family NAD(P)-dependent oxidoreductase [Mycolicibacterium stellerae]